jgi:hypothetical protein
MAGLPPMFKIDDGNYTAEFLAYGLISLLILQTSAVLIFSLWRSEKKGKIDWIMMALAAYLGLNFLTERNFWSPHTQLFNILAPVFCLWTFYQAAKRPGSKKVFLFSGLAGLLATALLTAGCASRGEIETMQSQLDYLERSSAQMQERIAMLDSLYRDALDQNITYQADLKLVLEDLLDRTNIIDGRLTDIESRVANILNRMGGDVPVTSLPGQTDTTTDTTGQEALPRVDAKQMWDNAFDDMRRGDYDLAIMQFE